MIFLHHRKMTTKKSNNPKANLIVCDVKCLFLLLIFFVSENVAQLQLCDSKNWNILTVSQQVSCSNTDLAAASFMCAGVGSTWDSVHLQHIAVSFHAKQSS